MPKAALSASDYTKFVKFQAAQQSYLNNKVPIPIQTRDQVAPTTSIMNANIKASEMAFRVNPGATNIASLASVRPFVGAGYVNRPDARSAVTYASGGALSSSRFVQAGGMPAAGKVGTYTRLPQIYR